MSVKPPIILGTAFFKDLKVSELSKLGMVTIDVLEVEDIVVQNMDAVTIDVEDIISVTLTSTDIEGSTITDGTVSMNNGILSTASGDDISFLPGSSSSINIGSVNNKIGLYGTSPIFQATTSITSSIISGGGSTSIDTNTTFNGYTVAQVVQALQNIGILE
jgi:hypothetical protein